MDTVERLRRRIDARFATRGLSDVAAELSVLARDVAEGSGAIRGRLRVTRLVSRVLVAAVVVAALATLWVAVRDAVVGGPDRGFEWLPLIESAVNDLVFTAIAVWFLVALPSRLERGRLLGLLHRLRSLAHIIDMHQLTKDPERLRDGYESTTASVDPGLGRADMEHYLDYCSELLSLVGKTAALCAEESRDDVVLATVATVERLTTEMSSKIWQKISLLPD
ncbi:hypothetical protein JQN70_14215 [Phycicoccus sp. MQZ13P-5]|uniref:Uncharacterized protein n=1 Tax=Phycicoccus sonneratiae TaxID=2807628 RepID=A0ABS2CNU4_9MICO|nr:hypothetical protein [Phycicoccus sonneraticus]